MKLEKVMINGKGYYHYRDCGFLDLCERCCFMKKDDSGAVNCLLPFKCEPKGYYISYNEKPNILGGVKLNADDSPSPESIPYRIVPNGQYAEIKADDVKKVGGIGKRSYYSFPNGVEAEDICRYLSFNLGNVVKYSCRAGRKDATKKIEDLRKAKDYLEDEIKRLEEGDD